MVLVPGGGVDKMFTLKVTLDDDPVRVADWLATFQQQFDETSRAAESIVEAVETDAELHAELERFRQNWPRYRERFDQLHDGLVALGYRPVLPKKLKPTSVRAYIAYHKPSGERVFENNSSTSYIAGTERRERLRGSHEWLIDSGQRLSVQFDTAEKVEYKRYQPVDLYCPLFNKLHAYSISCTPKSRTPASRDHRREVPAHRGDRRGRRQLVRSTRRISRPLTRRRLLCQRDMALTAAPRRGSRPPPQGAPWRGIWCIVDLRLGNGWATRLSRMTTAAQCNQRMKASNSGRSHVSQHLPTGPGELSHGRGHWFDPSIAHTHVAECFRAVQRFSLSPGARGSPRRTWRRSRSLVGARGLPQVT